MLLCGVEALVVHAVDANDLEPPVFDEIRDRSDEPEVLVLIEAPLRRGKPDHRAAGVPEPEELHRAAQDRRVPFHVLAVHQRFPPKWLVTCGVAQRRVSGPTLPIRRGARVWAGGSS